MASVTLKSSNSVTSSANGQKIVGLDVSGTITITHNNVVVMGCRVRHSGAKGITSTGAHTVIIDTYVHNIGAPTGQTAESSSEYNNIQLENCDNARLHRVRLRGGSAGVYALTSDRVTMTQIEGYDFKGPLPRGQFVQFNQCAYPYLVGFSCINDPNNSHPEDQVSCFASNNGYVADGLVDGNNAPTGVGIMSEGSTDMTFVDIDAVRMMNGSFAAFSAGAPGSAASNISYSDCNSRDTIATDQGRGGPSSGGVIYISYDTDQSNVDFQGEYYNHTGAAVTYLTSQITSGGGSVSVAEVDFTLKSAIELTFAWE